MRLSKIQKFLKENNINYKMTVQKYGNNEFGEITIKDEKINATMISEITGTRGKSVSGIMLFFTEEETNRRESVTFDSQNAIIERLKNEIRK